MRRPGAAPNLRGPPSRLRAARARPSRLRAARACLALALLASATSCTYEDVPGPLPQSSGVLAIETLSPKPGSLGVRLDPLIDVRFSRPLAAETINSRDLRVFSGRIEAPGKISVDLLARRLRFTPSGPFVPRLRFRVFVRARLRGLDGSRSGESTVFDFTTGDAVGPERPPRPVVTSSDVQPLWDARCSSARCHSAADAAAGIDLSSPERVLSTLLNRPSPIDGVPQIRAGQHARSYLLRKLLGTAGFLGGSMPPGGPPFTAAELRKVADWIDGMASP